MKPFDDLLARARHRPRHIALAEGDDPRVVEGALRALRDGVAEVTLIGPASAVREHLERQGGGDGLALRVVDPATAPHLERYAQELLALRKAKGMTPEAAAQVARDPLYHAALMVRLGEADGCVGGAVATTAATVRAALQVIGPAPGSGLVSSFFIMMLCEPHHDALKGAMIFADCGLNVSPDAEELARIAIASADSARDLLHLEPKVAMLSFSTGGSASHPLVDKVATATALARAARPDLAIEGDIQLDASLIPEIRARKTTGSGTAGMGAGAANVLIFPDLNAGNIGYKLAERLGKAKAIGPVLQGLAKPANDLSRGCTADDVFRMIVVTVAQANAR
ncbi:phosphate acetyltransferase [Arenibaculum sp.]|uniref:phosphate acetyltransferase n=1 Tax=Arenibaculum sp. TaxID=2865862 RepID=UPI002E0EC63A|nr:phosphate acetyltransferase [Arenibaculum sp.]